MPKFVSGAVFWKAAYMMLTRCSPLKSPGRLFRVYFLRCLVVRDRKAFADRWGDDYLEGATA